MKVLERTHDQDPTSRSIGVYNKHSVCVFVLCRPTHAQTQFI